MLCCDDIFCFIKFRTPTIRYNRKRTITLEYLASLRFFPFQCLAAFSLQLVQNTSSAKANTYSTTIFVSHIFGHIYKILYLFWKSDYGWVHGKLSYHSTPVRGGCFQQLWVRAVGAAWSGASSRLTLQLKCNSAALDKLDANKMLRAMKYWPAVLAWGPLGSPTYSMLSFFVPWV